MLFILQLFWMSPPSFLFLKQSSLARNAGAHLNDNEIEDFYDQNDNRDEGVERNHDEDKLNECESVDEYEYKNGKTDEEDVVD